MLESGSYINKYINEKIIEKKQSFQFNVKGYKNPVSMYQNTITIYNKKLKKEITNIYKPYKAKKIKLNYHFYKININKMKMIYSSLKYLDDKDFNNVLISGIATKHCPNNLIELNKEFNTKIKLLYQPNYKVNQKILNFKECLIEDSG